MSTYRKQLKDLYTEEHLATRNDRETHAGLWLDKYIKNQHQDDNESRSELVEDVAMFTVPKMYRQFYERWKEMLANAGCKTTLEAKTSGRMVIGLGDESVLETSITLHHTYGVPYIPGSALKGLAASYARQRLGEKWAKGSDAYNIIFGDTAEAGWVTFFDALLCPDADKLQGGRVLYQDIITVHHPDYYQGQGNKDTAPTDWDSPTPIPFLSARGTYLVALAAPGLEHGRHWINTTFAILRHALKEWGIGAKTSSGYGRMELERVEEDEELEVMPEPPVEEPQLDLELIKAQRLIQEISDLPATKLPTKIDDYYQRWKKITSEEGRTLVATAFLEKVRVAGRTKISAEKAWYRDLVTYLSNK